MSSNLILLACLLSGLCLGLFTKSSHISLANRLLTVTVLVLVFMMGAALGLREDLGSRILSYGYSAILITVFAIVGSIASVKLLVLLFSHKNAE
jgi:uncharacterized membrane protein YbjE (DUF340 family)